MKIVVLAGGTSTERSVSITSGTMVCKALREKNHQAVLVDVFCGIDVKGNLEDVFAEEAYDIDKAAEYMHSFDAGLNEMIESRRRFFGPNVLELCEAADVVFLALHGANGEDGKVQATFDLLGIPYTGTGYLSSALAMDKSITKQFFRAHHVPTPNGVTLKKGQESEPLSGFGLELPVVVKPCCGGSSVGVYIAHTNEEYWQAMKDAFSYEPEVVVEEYIEGREFSVGVVDGKAYPIIEIAPIEGFYDYTNKYKAGATVDTCPAVLSSMPRPSSCGQENLYAGMYGSRHCDGYGPLYAGGVSDRRSGQAGSSGNQRHWLLQRRNSGYACSISDYGTV